MIMLYLLQIMIHYKIMILNKNLKYIQEILDNKNLSIRDKADIAKTVNQGKDHEEPNKNEIAEMYDLIFDINEGRYKENVLPSEDE